MNSKPLPTANARKAYATPRLAMYGNVRVLTQSGTGAQMENAGQNMVGPTFKP